MTHKGFSLVELMVAALIAGILLMAIFPLVYSAHQRWENEKIRTSSVRVCDQIYRVLENHLKAAEKEEIEIFMHGEWEDSEFARLFDDEKDFLEQKIQIELEEETEGFLVLTVRSLTSENKIVYEKRGVILALNMTLKEKADAGTDI